MAITKRAYTAEERAEQIKACCETIIENAEKLAEGIDLSSNWKITIDMPCHAVPTITFEHEFLSSKVLDCIMRKDERVD